MCSLLLIDLKTSMEQEEFSERFQTLTVKNWMEQIRFLSAFGSNDVSVSYKYEGGNYSYIVREVIPCTYSNCAGSVC